MTANSTTSTMAILVIHRKASRSRELSLGAGVITVGGEVTIQLEWILQERCSLKKWRSERVKGKYNVEQTSERQKSQK